MDITQVQNLSFTNAGGSALSFRLLSDKPWLDVQPATGVIQPGASQLVTLVVRADQAGGDARASVTIFTNGGTATLPVAIPFQIHGLYQGQVTLNQPEYLGNRELSLYLSEHADGSLSGVVDVSHSAAFGVPASISGTAESDAGVDLTFVLAAPYGSAANPTFQQSLIRTIHILAAYPGVGPLTGSYEERIEGMLAADAGPAIISGTVVLNPLPATTFPSVQSTTVTLSDPTYPDPGVPSYCLLTCPGDCSTDLTAGASYLRAAFPILSDYADAGYAAVTQCIDLVHGSCLYPAHLACAQARFQRAIANNNSADCGAVDHCATRGLIDSFRGLYAWQMLTGNQLLANSHVIDGTTTLANQETFLASAEGQLAHSVLTNQAGDPYQRGMLDPFFVRWLYSLDWSYFNSQHNTLIPTDLLSGANGYVAIPYSDLQPIANALSRQLVATLEHVNLRQRLDGNPTAALQEATAVTAAGHVSLALAANLFKKLRFTAYALTPAASAMTALSQKTTELAAGFNPVGLPPQYIAYTYNPSLGNASNNFLTQLADFRATYLPNVTNAYQIAMNTQRTYDTDQAALSQELVNETTTYGQQVVAACGGSIQDLNASLTQCGQTNGAVYDAKLDMQAAADRIQLAATAIDTVYKSIQIEEDQAAQIAQVHSLQANLILANGQQLNVLNGQESILRDVQLAFNGVASAFSSYGATAVEAVVGIAVNSATTDIETQKQNIATTEQAQVEYNVAQQTLIESAARIKTMLLQIPSLKINVDLALIDSSHALARAKSAAQAAIDGKALHDLAQEHVQVDPRGDPSFRIYRDHTIVTAETAMQNAMRQLFITTRSLEYELNASYAASSQLFGVSVPSDLQAYADQLSSTYTSYIASVGQSQSRLMTLSLRNDVFHLSQPLTDSTTGQVYSPEERFHRLIADPRNRDSAGNVRLQFTLSLSPDTSLFNPSFCSDRIDNIRASLVGASLGATAPEIEVAERGTAYLRSCTDQTPNGDYKLVDYNQDTLGLRRAIIQSGVNLSGPNDPLAPPPDIELFGRPISASYELTIDVHSPANTTLDLTKLDDIVLYVAHETRTVR